LKTVNSEPLKHFYLSPTQNIASFLKGSFPLTHSLEKSDACLIWLVYVHRLPFMSYMYINILLVALVICVCPLSLLKVLLSHLSGGMIDLCGIWY